MINFSLVYTRSGATDLLEMAQIRDLLTGSSIVRLEQVDDALRLGLSSGLQMTIHAIASDKIEVTAAFTSNERYAASTRIVLVSSNEDPFAAVVEYRVRCVRQIYAMLVLLEEERLDELHRQLKSHADIESLLSEDERLIIVEAGVGSFLVGFATKAYGAIKTAPHRALDALTAMFAEGRTLLLRRAKAGVRLKEAEAARAELDLKEKQLEAIVNGMNKISTIKDKDFRKMTRDAFVRDMKGALGPERENVIKQLPADAD